MGNEIKQTIGEIVHMREFNRLSKVGSSLVCPSCNAEFIKETYQQVFCNQCKDKYWNTVDPSERKNTTRISPSSAIWMRRNKIIHENYTFYHPFSSESHGQWNY